MIRKAKIEFYLGTNVDMRAIFFANGPSFKSGHVGPWMKLVDEYQVFLSVLGLEGEEHEGTWERVEDLLVDEEEEQTTTTESDGTQMTNGIALVVLMYIWLAVVSL